MSIARLVGVLILVAGLAAALYLSQRSQGPLRVSGLIEADEIRLGSRVGGRVREVPAIEGAQVKAGEVLVELEPFDLIERRVQAEKTLEARRADYERLRAGFRPEEIGEAEARRDQLAAKLERLMHG